MIITLTRHVCRPTVQNAEGYCANYDDEDFVKVVVKCEVWLSHGDLPDDEVVWLDGSADSLTDEERDEAACDAIVQAWFEVVSEQKAAQKRLAAKVLRRIGGALEEVA